MRTNAVLQVAAAAALLLLSPAEAFAAMCGPGVVKVHELLGSSPDASAWAVRRLTVPNGECGGADNPDVKSPYPKIKGRVNHGTELLLCRAGKPKCQEFVVYAPVDCSDEKGKTSEAQAAKNLAEAKKAFAAEKIDLTKPGKPVEKSASLPAELLAKWGISGGASLTTKEGLALEAPGFGKVVLQSGSSERCDGGFISTVPVAQLSADGQLVFWAMTESLCGDETSIDARSLSSVVAELFGTRGAERYRNKSYAEAAKDFAAAQAIDPLPRTQLRLGHARFLAGQKDEALADLEKALQADPTVGVPRFGK